MWKKLDSNHLYQPNINAKYGLNFTLIPEECINIFIPSKYFQYPIVLRNEDGKQLLFDQNSQQFRYITNDSTQYLTWTDLSQHWEIFE